MGVQQDGPELLYRLPCRQSIGKAPVLDPPFEDMAPPVGRPNKQERVSYASTYDLARNNPPWNRKNGVLRKNRTSGLKDVEQGGMDDERGSDTSMLAGWGEPGATARCQESDQNRERI